MKKASPETTIDIFLSNLYFYIELLNKIYTAKYIVSTSEEKEIIFESLLLRIHAHWETFIEDILIDCLNRDTSKYVEYTGFKLPKHVSRDLCSAILIGTKYLDFRSVGEVKKLANNILVDSYNPFKTISKTVAGKIDDFTKLRNYLSHQSFAAERTLMKMYKSRYKLQSFRSPGNFLLVWDKRTNQTRFGNYIDAFLEATDQIAKFLDVDIS